MLVNLHNNHIFGAYFAELKQLAKTIERERASILVKFKFGILFIY